MSDNNQSNIYKKLKAMCRTLNAIVLCVKRSALSIQRSSTLQFGEFFTPQEIVTPDHNTVEHAFHMQQLLPR